MAIANRNLPVGTRLVAKYKGANYSAVVVEPPPSAEIVDGPSAAAAVINKPFKSLSAAGSAIMGGIACNGWRFWSVEGEEPEAPPPGTFRTAKEASAAIEQKRKARLIYRVPNQKGAPEGQVRWWCNACMDGFMADTGTKPDACPAGHHAADFDEVA